MPRGVVALLMVVLIGDPVCCCTLAGAAGPSEEESAACCRAEAALPTPAEDHTPPATCPCARKTGVVAPDKLAVPLPVLLAGPAPLSAPSELLARPAFASDAARLPGSAPGMVRAKAPPPRVLYSVFRC